MKRELYEMSQLPVAEQAKVAQYVSEFTQSPDGQAAELLPLQPEEILARSLGVVACIDRAFAGYAGRRDEGMPAEKRVEIGPFVVDPQQRYRGHGRALLTKVAHEVTSQGQVPFVLGNQDNMRNLTTAGFKPVGWDELPDNTYRPEKPDNNVPVMLFGQPLHEDIPFSPVLPGLVLKMPTDI
jgi:hypothetical protein